MYIKYYKKWKQFKNPFYKWINLFLFKIWKRTEIEYILKQKLLWNKEIFWDNEFYQSYPPLWFQWERDTLLRFKNYTIEKYINKNTIILDIWWNVGFFSLYVSKYVKYIDVIEYNQNLVDIGNVLKDYEKIENISITQKDFNEFTPTKKYDIIFSFAVHKWIWMPFKEYIKKLESFLNTNWYVFLESQNLDIDPDFEKNIDEIPILNHHQIDALESIAHGYDKVQNPLVRLEHNLHGISAFFIMPLFAFSNAGVLIDFSTVSANLMIVLGVLFGLILGKPIGIVGFTYLLTKLKIIKKPDNISWFEVIAVGFLGGIGFTMSIFITHLAFNDEGIIAAVKLGIFAASLIAAILGVILVLVSSKKLKDRV